jgi:oxalate decarboxylase/phosphoglucose isomerase-like protein (cupin superfamily)
MTLVEAHDDSSTDAAGWKRAAQRALHPSGRRVDADVLAAIAAGLATVTVPWELREGESPTERRYQRVLVTPEYEAWVICWPSGGALDLHDHGGSAGAFSVVSGSLDEATIEATAEGKATVVRTYASGDTSAFGSARVHAIANRGTEPATSVHVYSPPLSSMVYYEHDEANGLVAVAEDAGGWL